MLELDVCFVYVHQTEFLLEHQYISDLDWNQVSV